MTRLIVVLILLALSFTSAHADETEAVLNMKRHLKSLSNYCHLSYFMSNAGKPRLAYCIVDHLDPSGAFCELAQVSVYTGGLDRYTQVSPFFRKGRCSKVMLEKIYSADGHWSVAPITDLKTLKRGGYQLHVVTDSFGVAPLIEERLSKVKEKK